jgi:hypothetical protein
VDGYYFQALRIPLLRGRTFGAQDATRPMDEAIVSHAFAERYWPGTSPLGKRVRPLGGRWHTVVGEVGDVLSATPGVLLIIAFIASWIPAHRAAAVRPAEALRSQ